MTRGIIHVIEQLGYAVRVWGDRLTAQKLDDPATRHVVKLDGPADPDEQHRAACHPAEAVGIDLEDG